MTHLLVWHWGRRGAGPRFAAELAAAFRRLPGVTADLSLSAQAEILRGDAPPPCALPFPTYANTTQALLRLPTLPVAARRLATTLARSRYALAICAMPAPADPAMVAALARAGIPYAAILHDAETHPGDHFPLQSRLRRHVARRAAAVIALTTHVADRLVQTRQAAPGRLILARHPPFSLPPMPRPLAHGGKPRLLAFGRLLPYKGLDLLAEAVASLGPDPGFELLVAGSGPESSALTRLAALGARVENRWVPEAEIPALLAWADILVLSHTEASQSGVAACGIAAGRWLVATDVGGLGEQLRGAPGCRLCAPQPAALAAALAAMIKAPPPPPLPADPAGEWTAMAAALLHDLAGHIGGIAALPATGKFPIATGAVAIPEGADLAV